MSVRSASSFPRADSTGAGAAVLLGLFCLTAAWAVLHLPFFERYQIIDTPVYREYGEAIAEGRAPYRDFAVEYPPAALPVFWLPTLAPSDHYESAFEVVMWICAVAMVAFVVLALAHAGASRARLFAGAAFAGLAPLALGSVVLTRYDFWPAALAAGALAALLAGRERLGLGVLAVAAAAKIYPLVLLPPALVLVWRRGGARALGEALGVFALVAAAILVPFALVSPDGLADSLGSQLGRPLQIESLGAALLLAGHQLGAYAPTVVSTHGSQNLAGPLPDALALAQTVLQAAAVAGVWLAYAARGPGGDRLLAASAAAVTGFVAFGKVLSPQFLVWLIPLVALAGGRLGLAAGGTFAGALVLTHVWFPFRYWDVVALEPEGWLVLVRDLLLVALYAVLLASVTRRPAAPRSW